VVKVKALCQYAIVFLESISEALILLMKNKFTYMNTIAFLCKYNTEHADFNLFYIKHVAKQKYNSYKYVKINVFTPNTPVLAPVLSKASLHNRAV